MQTMNKYYTFDKYERFKLHLNTQQRKNNTKHDRKKYTDTELLEYHFSYKPGSYEYKSAKPKLLAARVENKGTQSLGQNNKLQVSHGTGVRTKTVINLCF